MYLSELKSHIIPTDFKKSTYYTALFRAREINEVIELALINNRKKYKLYDNFDINPIIFQVEQELYPNKKGPFISLLYHLPTISMIVKLYKNRVVVIKSDEWNTIELKNSKKHKNGEFDQELKEMLKNIF